MIRRYDIALSGASSKIPLHVGFMKCLEAHKVKYNELYGTSSGSIVAAAMAIGKNSNFLYKTLRDNNLNDYAKISIWRNLLNIFSQSWLNDGKKLETFLDEVFEGKTMDQVDYPLHILCHNLEHETYRDFNSREHPTMKISKALRMSCSLPILFKPVRHEGECYIDGGISKNFPVDLPRFPCIGHIVSGKSTKEQKDWQKIRKSAMAVHVIYQAINSNVKESILQNQNKDNGSIIVASYEDKSPYDFSLAPKELNDMIRIGYQNTLAKITGIIR